MKPSNRRVEPAKPSRRASVAERAPAEEAPPESAPAGRVTRALRTIAGFALVVSIAGAVAWGARRYVKTTPRFAVSEIVVNGNKRRTAEEVAAIASLGRGANVFSVDLDSARAKLLGDPWIKDAVLARRLPGTLLLRVTEREAAGIVVSTETYLTTSEGEIFKRVEAGDPTDLPIVTGVSVQMLAEDREGAARCIRRALDLAAEYERTPLAQRAPLEEVHLKPDGGIQLVVGKNAIVLSLGDPPFRKKLDEALRVFVELDKRGAKPDTILLDNDARPERVTVRMR